MQLISFGNTFVKIITKSPESGDSIVLIDPFQTKTIGQRQPKMDADVVLHTQKKYDTKLTPADAFVIDRPGEYETKSIFVYGTSFEDNTLYSITAEKITIGHLGLLPNTQLPDKAQELLEGSDVLFVPVGGETSLDAKQAAALVGQLEPRIVIPMNYAFTGAKTKLTDLKPFLKELGNPKTEITTKFSIKKKDLPQDETKIVLLHE